MRKYARLLTKFVFVTFLVLVVCIVTPEVASRVIPVEWEPRVSWYARFAQGVVALAAGLLSIVTDLRDIVRSDEKTGVEPETLRAHLVAQVRRQVAREQNRKRYIPDVFAEVSVIKDRARFFAHPVLFVNKLVDTIGRLNFGPLNRILARLSLERVLLEVPSGLEAGSSLQEVEDHATSLEGVLADARRALSLYSRADSAPPPDSITVDGVYFYEELKFPLAWTARAVERKIARCADDLRAIRSRVLFLIGRAGQGKTNFVCDFAMNVLLGRSLPCLFLTGGDLDRVDPDRLGDYLARHVVGDFWAGELRRMLADLDRLALAAQAPVTIIVDGLSDLSDIHGFSRGLESLIEEILRDSTFVRFILTCRAEYFGERFANFKQATFAHETLFVEDFDRCMRSAHREHLVDAYFSFFNLRCPYLSRCARERLEGDTLLLRMFCEAYGDPQAQDVLVLPQILDIYRDEIFRIYLSQKIEGAAQHTERGPRLDIGLGARYKRLLSRILELMIARGQFVEIPIVDLGEEYNATLAEMLGEDIIVRKDLVRGRSVLDEQSEVISFTFDEFRDFLLSDHFVTVVFPSDRHAFREMVDKYCVPGSPVAEGVSKFLFYASKRPENEAIFAVIAETSWYRDVFVECIFSLQEDFITEDDLEQIQSRFHDGGRSASRIISSLIRRWRTDIYPTLNIRLLFRIMETLDKTTHDRLVAPALKGDYVLYSYYDRPWPIDQLVDDILEILIGDGSQSSPCCENLAELLVFLFDIEGRDRSCPAYVGLCELAKTRPDLAVTVLAKHTTIANTRIAERVWRVASALAREGKVSGDMVEQARRQLPELHLSASSEKQCLSGAVAGFLSVCEGLGI